MHIKQIIISNFRSFKSQPEVQPFSQGTNAVVGRNGAGKSNLFDAVQFALLSPKFWTLRTVSQMIMYCIRMGMGQMEEYALQVVLVGETTIPIIDTMTDLVHPLLCTHTKNKDGISLHISIVSHSIFRINACDNRKIAKLSYTKGQGQPPCQPM